MRIDKADRMDMGIVVAATERKENAAVREQETSVVRIEKSRKGDAWLEQATYANPAKEEEMSIEDIGQQAGQKDAVQRKNEMLFAADHTSAKDAKAIEEDGFSLNDTEIPTVVTETDKIKAVLAEAGVDISCFGDTLSKEQLEAIAGSTALAIQMEQVLQAADLPFTEQNSSDLLETVTMMGELTAPTEGSIKYLLDNELSITTANLYKAQFSGGSYYTGAQNAVDYTALEPQIQSVITESGLPLTAEYEADCRWMIENGIALTTENLTKLTQLQALELPMSNEQVIEYAVAGMQEGRRAQDALIIEPDGLKEQAERAMETILNVTDEQLAYVVDSGKELTIENLREAQTHVGEYTKTGLELLTARRQLEETRLMMSTQANLALLKKGVSIDTLSLSKLVEELKEQENTYYQKLLESDGIDATAENTAIFADTIRTVEQLKGMPAYAIGMQQISETTLQSLHNNGQVLQDTFERAGERYETMMTSVRSDLGDSIQKAFRNIDDILTDLNLDINPTNQRAVRILAYNQMEITQENVTYMKAADEAVQRAFANLKPAVVCQMIKEGENPLDMSLDEINAVSEKIQETLTGKEEERFGKYLWQLEQHQDISEEERSAYIGIYRLIRQVEKTDGAAIGALLQQGGDITMRGLLRQVRSSNRGRMDYSVDEEFAGVSAKESGQVSITDQIAAGYQKNRIHDIMDLITPDRMRQAGTEEEWLDMTPEQLAERLSQADAANEADEAYAKEQIQALQQAAVADKEIYEWLEHYDMPVTVNHVLAAEAYKKNRNNVFQTLFSMEEHADMKRELQGIKEQILKAFGEAVKTPEEMAEAQEKLAETAENVMKDMIESDSQVSSLDIRQMKLVTSQIALAGQAAKEEQYAIPVLVQGEVCNVSLKIVRGEKKQGLVDIVFETDKLGKVAAELRAEKDKVTGYIVADSKDTAELFAGCDELFQQQFSTEENQGVELTYVTGQNLDLLEFGKEHVSAEQSGEEEEKVKTKRLYGMAESFLNVVKSLESETDIDNIGR